MNSAKKKEELFEYANVLFSINIVELRQKRRELLELINGDLFYQLHQWPQNYRLLFWKKPLSDNDTFKMFLFLTGNGCPIDTVQKWILTSNYWSTGDVRKRRMYQLAYLHTTLRKGQKDSIWFYYDMHRRLHVFLNGKMR